LRGRAPCRICPLSLHECHNAYGDVEYSIVRKCKGGHMGYFRPASQSNGWCLNCLITGQYSHVKKAD
jgi:hypothetical protein